MSGSNSLLNRRRQLYRVRDAFLSLDTGRQIELGKTALDRMVCEAVQDAYLKKHFKEYTIGDYDEIKAELAKDPNSLMHKRMLDMFITHAPNLWPFVLLGIATNEDVLRQSGLFKGKPEHVRDYTETINMYLQQFGETPSAYDYMNHNPTLESVSDQRDIPYRDRELALHLQLMRKIKEAGEYESVFIGVLDYIDRSFQIYKEAGLARVQSAVSDKLTEGQKEKLSADTKRWGDIDRLALMCVSREFRTIILHYNGVMVSDSLVTSLSSHALWQRIRGEQAVLDCMYNLRNVG